MSNNFHKTHLLSIWNVSYQTTLNIVGCNFILVSVTMLSKRVDIKATIRILSSGLLFQTENLGEGGFFEFIAMSVLFTIYNFLKILFVSTVLKKQIKF